MTSRAFRTIGCDVFAIALICAIASAAVGEELGAAMLKDEVFARKVLMDIVDHTLDKLELSLNSGRSVDLADAAERADAISVMLMAFPHLFPSSTNQWRANTERDPAHDTFASPDLWLNFSDFYQRAMTASRLAHDASWARQEGEFRNAVASLRAACNSCHAVYVKTDK